MVLWRQAGLRVRQCSGTVLVLGAGVGVVPGLGRSGTPVPQRTVAARPPIPAALHGLVQAPVIVETEEVALGLHGPLLAEGRGQGCGAGCHRHGPLTGRPRGHSREGKWGAGHKKACSPRASLSGTSRAGRAGPHCWLHIRRVASAPCQRRWMPDCFRSRHHLLSSAAPVLIERVVRALVLDVGIVRWRAGWLRSRRPWSGGLQGLSGGGTPLVVSPGLLGLRTLPRLLAP